MGGKAAEGEESGGKDVGAEEIGGKDAKGTGLASSIGSDLFGHKCEVADMQV